MVEKIYPLILDLELDKPVDDRRTPRVHGVEYYDGWKNQELMVPSVVCCFDYRSGRYRVFTKESFDHLAMLIASCWPIVGHNIIGHDAKVLAGQGICEIAEENCYDTLRELWVGAGLAPTWKGRSHWGFGLDAVVLANFDLRKTGSGERAGLLWQRGEVGSVIDYCLECVRLTKMLFERMAGNGVVTDPRDPTQSISTRTMKNLPFDA